MRKASVRYYASREGYYTQLHGKQHRLATGPDDQPTGPTFLAALTAYRQLLELGAVDSAKDSNTVRALCETYMRHAETRLEPATLQTRQKALKSFVAKLGDVAVRDLTHFKVEDFIAGMRQTRRVGPNTYRWGEGYVRVFLLASNAVFNWAVKRKLISENPIKGLEKPEIRSRSRDCLVSPAQHQVILDTVRSPHLRRVIVALENSGARPGEIVHATAGAWDDAAGALVYYSNRTRKDDEHRHKTASKRDRVIYFTGPALDMMRELVQRHPTGPLFRTRFGGGYTVAGIVSSFAAIRERVTGMPHLTAYSYRHTLATNFLLAGGSVDHLAAIMGNTPQVIRLHYSHLLGDHAALRRVLEDFRVHSGGK